ncbi:major tail protein [Mycobacterium phage Quink]|uniref:Major tail protein n=9 Tax=Viruses TaxID=10239 RepID=Q857Z3_9CAUD|nr:major tail protein [Mycobacterium phage Cjw1]YP_002014338.1 major tail protein [Mycobacterium phage Porky]YP_008051497.1 major tail protein [Mycobacterium phage Murphy]YP_008051643.1 major tail protein [Mycobacterium phage Dumbo]YP_008051954.1 major tail protein [Mycobacterium phage Phrux]YP_008531095.1 major tail protein [Mycobacterium phage Quink]YP_009011779.1 major tail protein [Mycobacterium phage Lilac]YP_654774.1 major tail protein [Mycobacterium phage 244]AEL21777.1 major tail su
MSELWTGLYQGNADRIRKWLYGSVLIRDWKPDGSTSLADFTPFDPTDGNLKDTLLSEDFPGGRFYEIGAITEDGVEFNPKFSTDDTKIWQSRRAQRTDVTEDDEEVMFTAAENTPLIDYLRYNLPLENVPSVGTAGYKATKPNYTDMVYRQIVVIGVDGRMDEAEYVAEVRPRVSLTKVGKQSFKAKEIDGTELTFGVYPDPASGFPARRIPGGPFWAESGGPVLWPTPEVAPVATLGTDEVTIVLQEPVSPNTPFTYTVSQTSGGTTTAATLVGEPVTDEDGEVTITVEAPATSGSYTFKVTAEGSNGETAESQASNSVTVNP